MPSVATLDIDVVSWFRRLLSSLFRVVRRLVWSLEFSSSAPQCPHRRSSISTSSSLSKLVKVADSVLDSLALVSAKRDACTEATIKAALK